MPRSIKPLLLHNVVKNIFINLHLWCAANPMLTGSNLIHSALFQYNHFHNKFSACMTKFTEISRALPAVIHLLPPISCQLSCKNICTVKAMLYLSIYSQSFFAIISWLAKLLIDTHWLWEWQSYIENIHILWYLHKIALKNHRFHTISWKCTFYTEACLFGEPLMAMKSRINLLPKCCS